MEIEEQDEVPDLDFLPVKASSKKKGGMDTEQEKANLDWGFYDPSEDQFQAIKVLATRFLFTISEASSELADVIVKNAALGTMIGMSDHEIKKMGQFTSNQIFAMLTILHIPTYKSTEFVKDLMTYVKQKSLKDNFTTHQETFNRYLDDPKLGLLVNERY